MATNYHVYSNDGAGGAIDYATPIATVTTPGYLTGPLTPGTWSFAVRAFDTVSGLEERNADAVVDVAVSAGLADISAVPFAPRAVTATVSGSGTVRVSWAYPYTERTRAPVGFRVYQGSPATPSYAAPVATVSYAGQGYLHYRATIAGLTGGIQYAFAVRAYNATGEESNATVVSVTALTTAPADVDSLTGTPL